MEKINMRLLELRHNIIIRIIGYILFAAAAVIFLLTLIAVVVGLMALGLIMLYVRLA